MKTPEEYLKSIFNGPLTDEELDIAYYSNILTLENTIEAIKQAQTDTYNEALENAAESAKASIKREWEGNTGSEYYSDYAVVDKQSILKLKK